MNDTKYIVDYYQAGKPTGQVRKLFETLLKECMKPQYMAGYPVWRPGQEIKHLGLPLTPGMHPQSTWCPFVAGYVIHKMGYDIRPITDPKRTGWKAIWYTSGNEMAELAALAADAGVIIEISERQVNEYANQGIPVLVAATGVISKKTGKRGAGHVAIAAPCRTDQIMVGQAGTHNGFFQLEEAFPGQYVTLPRFFVPNRKGVRK